MKTFREDLDEAVAYHGHLCAGQIIGVRMARLALRTLGITEPKMYRDLIVYVESDRCLTDSIGTVTGCKLGRRNLKSMDYGKSAATFLDLKTGDSYRVKTKYYIQAPEDSDLIDFFDSISDDYMFVVTPVKVKYRPEDLPGKPLDSMTCPKCGEEIIDGRQVEADGVYMCKACAYGAYYDTLS